MKKVDKSSKADLDPKNVLKQIELQEPKFSCTIKTFCTQIVMASSANIMGQIAGHPLDTVRVRMQVSAGNPTVLGTMKSTWQLEGTRGFFKGLIAPLVGSTPYNTIVFTLNENAKNYLTAHYPQMDVKTQSLIGGSVSGFFALIVYNPIELVKCRAQVHRTESIPYRVVVPQLIRNEGFMALYKGFWALAARDVPGWATYFWTYEVLKDQFGLQEADKNGDAATWMGIMTRLWCAGVAGQVSWIVSYPADVIKTQMQCTQETKLTMREVVVRGYREGGIYYFYKGLQPTLLRGFVTNSICLTAFDYLNMRYKASQD